MLISVSWMCAAKCWRMRDEQLTREAWCLNVALMSIIVLGPKGLGCIHYRILWHDAGYLWLEKLRRMAIQQLMEYAISSKGGSPWHLGHSNNWRGSFDHTWDSVPNTWRLHELLLQDWLKRHVNAKGRCDGAELLCIPTVQGSWFTHLAICCAGILKCTMKSSNSVDSGEISRVLYQHGMDTRFSFVIGNTSHIATLHRHIKAIGALKFRYTYGCILMACLCLPGTLCATPNFGHPQNM